MFKKILIANRGEIALRVLRACREMGIATVAVHSEVDSRALHVRFADESVCIGPASATKSYLHIPAIISAAEITGADAVHPGYGFLSENAEFARLCGKCNVAFIGPTPEAMRAWGDKVTARGNAERFGLPLLTGSPVLQNAEHALQEAERVGFPVIMKASGGGGGRGMRIVRNAGEVAASFAAGDARGRGGVQEPRRVPGEVRRAAAAHRVPGAGGQARWGVDPGGARVLAAAPAPEGGRGGAQPGDDAGEASADGRRDPQGDPRDGYTSLGTLEFLMDEKGDLYFLEMNTRVQVEHPVTEMVTGLDLVQLQIRAARARSWICRTRACGRCAVTPSSAG